ncbi:dipeptidase [Geosporobacter ferrireducens]|uniref:Peptidase M19 n=1 Tax=Geosporobacter ferrireducens TaxID=1424294 RepID=A0A1D8GMU4_9FIRM|nr:dipeptidase [Geosporobacter ferrireducens]AOT72152.1 peptidase M19 [Geosporobacter ferrireducens]MTI56040.1 membrane dipeptidase [Geosporobacter ferrireducens]
MRFIDFHCDTILQLMTERKALHLNSNRFCVDIEKLRRSNSMAQFFALYINYRGEKDPLETCLEMADKFFEELAENEREISLARNYNEVMANDKQGKISAFLTIEEGGALKGELYHLRNFYRLGVRLITLTWNYPNEIGYPNCHPEFKNLGLTGFGEEVVKEMNHLGMLIDVSHLSDQGFYDVARLSKRPFIASHSNARGVTNHSRNLTDEMIRILAEKGGVMGINFEKEFLGNPLQSRVEDMVRHIRHIRNVGGIDVIAIGSDFDGTSPELEIADISELGKLVIELKKNKFNEDEIEKICYKNGLRVIKDVLL